MDVSDSLPPRASSYDGRNNPEELRRHALRRRDRIPTLTCLIGPQETAEEWVAWWASESRERLLRVTSLEALRLWLQAQRMELLELLLGPGAQGDGVVAELESAPNPVLPLRVRQAIATRHPDEQAAMERWLQTGELTRTAVPILLEALGWPGRLAVVLRPAGEEHLKEWLHLATRVPALTLFVISAEPIDTRGLPERWRGLVRESTIDLSSAEPSTPASSSVAREPGGAPYDSTTPSAASLANLEDVLRRRRAPAHVHDLARDAWAAHARARAEKASAAEEGAARSHAERLLYEPWHPSARVKPQPRAKIGG